MYEQFCMDLKDIKKFSNYNYKKKFLLVVIDAFSKKAWLEAIRNKTAPFVTAALDEILAQSGGIPKRINVDQRTEFLNKTMKSYLKSKGIELF